MNKTYPIPSKYPSSDIMLQSCNGYKPVKHESTTAPQSLVSVKRTVRVDNRIGVIL